MTKSPHREGQLSLELILLTLAVVIGGLIVGVELTKYHYFEGSGLTTIKNVSATGFAKTYNGTQSSNNTPHSNNTGVVENSTISVSGNGHLTFLGDKLTNYTLTNGSIVIQTAHDNQEYSVPEGGLKTLDVHITAWADTKIHNIQSIKNLDLKITGTGSSDMNTVLDSVSINDANIVNHGGGTTSNIYVVDSSIVNLNIVLTGGTGVGNPSEANLYITNSTIDSFNYTLEGSATIYIKNSTIDGSYISEKTISN
jgi:hypothetical protein